MNLLGCDGKRRQQPAAAVGGPRCDGKRRQQPAAAAVGGPRCDGKRRHRNNLISPSKSMDSNDRAWIVSRNRISQEYTLGLNNFLATAKRHLGVDGRTLCPCNRCENTWLQRLPMIRAHILQYGMLATYQRWIHHGESLSDEEEHDHFEDSSNNDEDDDTLRDAIMDEEGRMFFNVDRSTENDVEDKSDVNRGRFDKLIEQLNKELYPGSGNLTLLQYVVKLMHIKVLNKWSDKSVNMLLQFEQSILPSGHNLPTSYYEMKKIYNGLKTWI
ncbi:hypothetical protein Ccrd_018373 [Cynara cardunculus var. scolymus]|uniref:Transposase-associated domain-containing protein n=1 Tax=Cynara cardunculus var. scolymus TaxID=59895 RepID=A0A103Y6B7_CYNCS|nr:hypothetical protein Ccrd_018373 [Cynara cardunculus var. scolymus]